MLGLAILFLILNAQFLFAAQIIVYAGAVMVLFVFIIALLNPGVDMTLQRGSTEWIYGIVLGVLFAGLFGSLLYNRGLTGHTGSYTPDAIAATGNVQAIGVTDGFVYLGGHFQTYCGPQGGQHTCTNPIPRDKLLAVDENSGALQGWDPSANSVLGVFALMGDAATGDVLAGGDFTSIGLRTQQGYAQFTP